VKILNISKNTVWASKPQSTGTQKTAMADFENQKIFIFWRSAI
jgi:hypothetical protein